MKEKDDNLSRPVSRLGVLNQSNTVGKGVWTTNSKQLSLSLEYTVFLVFIFFIKYFIV